MNAYIAKMGKPLTQPHHATPALTSGLFAAVMPATSTAAHSRHSTAPERQRLDLATRPETRHQLGTHRNSFQAVTILFAMLGCSYA